MTTNIIKETIISALAIAVLILLPSCEEVIDIDLNSSNPKVVVEAVIEPDSVCSVLLTYTSSYFNNDKPKTIDNAVVILSVNKGVYETLQYLGNGLYKGSSIKGEINKGYKLDISTSDGEFSGSAYLPSKGLIKNISVKEGESFFGGEDDKGTYSLDITIEDNPNEVNYYIIEYTSDNPDAEMITRFTDDSNFGDNNLGEIEQWRSLYSLGDEVIVTVFSVDKDVYTFYQQLHLITGGGGMGGPSSTPYNPQSNLSGDVLGCFTARSVDVQKVIISN